MNNLINVQLELPLNSVISNQITKKAKTGISPSTWENIKLGKICNVKGGKRLPKG